MLGNDLVHLPDVRCPTWLWYGELDRQASARNGWWLAGRIPRSVLTVRRRSTHLATLLEHWDEVLVTLRGASAPDPVADVRRQG